MPGLILVPAKTLDQAKARLSGVLGAQSRRALTLAMLHDVTRAAVRTVETWVICSDAETAAVAREEGAVPVDDEVPRAGLNASLAVATASARRAGFDGVLVLASDLPCASADDVRAMIHTADVAIAPNRDGAGTNALWRHPPDVFETAFGQRSRAAHEARARTAGLKPLIVRRPGLAIDLDEPADIARALTQGVGPSTEEILGPIAHRLAVPHQTG